MKLKLLVSSKAGAAKSDRWSNFSSGGSTSDLFRLALGHSVAECPITTQHATGTLVARMPNIIIYISFLANVSVAGTFEPVCCPHSPGSLFSQAVQTRTVSRIVDLNAQEKSG